MGIMLVYDITNEKSFENIVKWLRNIDEKEDAGPGKMGGYLVDMSQDRFTEEECH
ncbi:unnamed protein product, partial [Timema podura]|nr:unnamed protein product [Timema podura]